jgi:taurine dioxygenase
MSSLPVHDLEPFGVEVDLDLAADLDEPTRRALADLLWHRHLLVFRGQTLDFDQQIDFMTCFGPVSRDDGEPAPRDFVSIDPAVGVIGSSRLPFHRDLSFSPLPLIALSLFGLDVEPAATSTLFVDSTRVFPQLPAELRERIGSMEALHVFPNSKGYGQYVRSTAPGGEPYDLRFPNTAHPIVMAHPHTGEPVLFVCGQTDHVVGLGDAESEELLTTLFEYSYAPEQVLEHWWEPGDLVAWDNIAIQHGRADQSSMTRRTLRRVVCGEKSFFEQHPQMNFQAGGDHFGKPPVLVED